jgi:hypothetical protein
MAMPAAMRTQILVRSVRLWIDTTFPSLRRSLTLFQAASVSNSTLTSLLAALSK